jgi:predicted nucleotidyltransferase
VAPLERGSLRAAVEEALRASPLVRHVTLVGSRAAGGESGLSDWDFLVDTERFDELAPQLPRLIEPLEPLSWLWDPLSDDATYFMFIVPGPTKVDLVFDRPPDPQPPWTVTAATLPLVDAHFWDFSLWLASKREKGNDELLAYLVPVLGRHILEPLGVDEAPVSIAHAVELYLPARERAEEQLRVRVPRALGDEVRPVLLR